MGSFIPLLLSIVLAFTLGTAASLGSPAAPAPERPRDAVLPIRVPTGALYVSNSNGSVTVYQPAAHGDAAPILTISGSATRLGDIVGLALGVAGNDRGSLYVANSVGNRVTAYAAGAQGNVTPFLEISGSDTGLNSPFGLVMGGADLYVANSRADSVTGYRRRVDRGVGLSPILTISGANTGLAVPTGLAVDVVGILYVANQVAHSVTVYAPEANGNVAPIRTISGTSTGLSSPRGLAVDGAGILYVADSSSNSVRVYTAGANGNVTPIRTIRGANTGLSGPRMLLLMP